MLNFIYNQILFYVSIAVILFIPGYFLLLAVFGKSKILTSLERFVLSFGLSIIFIDIALILLDKFNLLIDAKFILISILFFIIICFIIFVIKKEKSTENPEGADYSKNQTYLIISIILFSILIRAFFLSYTIAPTGTDLGHHMYWTKKIMVTGEIPNYEKIEIIQKDGAYVISEPSAIDDFIIGEHLIFASIGLVSKNDVTSAFPPIILFAINIMGMLALFVLSEKIFSPLPFGKNISITVLFFVGALFALSGSQGNFISGGVIGNLLGNLLIPLIFYFFFRGILEKNSAFFSLGLITSFGLAYTHHLSTFIFAFSLIFVLFFILLFQGKEFFSEIKKWLALIFSPSALAIIFFGIAFFFFVRMPGYIENQAVKTIVGEPSRSTKAGLSMVQIFATVGESRATLGIIGIILLFVFFKKNRYQSALLVGWFLSIFIMSWKPTLLHIDIPSSRIGNYLILPLVLAGAFALNWIFFDYLKNKENGYHLDKNWKSSAFLLLALYVSVGGFMSQAQSINPAKANSKFIETFAVSKYLAQKTTAQDFVLKDHNYVSADSWMKVFLMRDYNYPFTRSFLFRYDSPTREQCTLRIISEPKSFEAKKCFAETGINFVVINPHYDSSQFSDSKEFWKVYSSDLIGTYYKTKK